MQSIHYIHALASESEFYVLPRSATAFVTSALFFALILYVVVRKYFEYHVYFALGLKYGCLPPPQLPNQWPLGIDWIRKLWHSDSEQHLLAFLCSIADGYEPRNNLFQYLLVGPRAYHVLDPKNLEAVLSTNFQDYGFGDRHGVFSPLLGNGIFTQEGPAWKHSRELLRKQFIRMQYQNMDVFREHVDNLLECLYVAEGTIDLQPLFFKLTLDTTTALLLGRSVYSLRAEEFTDTGNKAFAENFDIAQGGLAKRFRLAPWHSLYRPSQFRRSCSIVHQFMDEYISERGVEDGKVNGQELSESFIDQLAQESGNHEMLRDQLLNILLAGRDTTACCLSWTLRLLVRHNSVMESLRQEVRSVVGYVEHPTREQIRKMPYLAMVIKESLRVYPPVPLNNRTANKTTMLPRGGGPDGTAPILVRKGEVVVFSQYVNARRKNIFGPDADEFRPERWEKQGNSNPYGWAYFPFNGGPRACLGQDFALMEVSYTIVRLLQAFETITLPGGETNEPVGTERQRLTLVLSCADGCRVELEKRGVEDG
ncbi:MAG: hypothetical protein ALECFALPRED_002318 [Alectoria fallacina]|uniref:Cytochrome P450 n=1 Tax=Alectoria fallacina TaxID=1903189 RepID=A0A8H3FLH6_9LECA|nr:MAG: hypothetical protein ALECFALPRED_002318 [Alectoria fallacina]